MRDTARYEAYLRPILQRLKAIDGRAPVSIMTCSVRPNDPQLQSWLGEGLSIECHTVDHPCPLLQGGDFQGAKSTYDRCVDLLHQIPSNIPVAFCTLCCDSLNTVSPRFFSEIFSARTPNGKFLQIDSSVFCVFTSSDPDIPTELLTDPNGQMNAIPAGGELPAPGFSKEELKSQLPAVLQRPEAGGDIGLRFVDLNGDAKLDIVCSNGDRYGVWLFKDRRTGWSIEVLSGTRGDSPRVEELPPIVRADGTDNGFFVHSGYLLWQNENTADLPDMVGRETLERGFICSGIVSNRGAGRNSSLLCSV